MRLISSANLNRREDYARLARLELLLLILLLIHFGFADGSSEHHEQDYDQDKREKLRPVDLPSPRDNLKTPMMSVTESAVQQLRSLLQSHAGSSGKGLRVAIAKGGCSGLQYEMSLDARKAGDAIVAREGVEFLVDEESAQLLRGATLDYNDGLTGTGFQILNPNAARTCGCGTSFEPAQPA